jgi:hypothetical protein
MTGASTMNASVEIHFPGRHPGLGDGCARIAADQGVGG